MKFGKISQDIEDIKRLEQILNVLFKHEMGYVIEKLNLKHLLSIHKRMQSKKFEEKETQPERIRKILEELGGTFIKLGQLLSIRADLIPKEYCDEFKKLQDEVNFFPGKDAKNIVSLELNKDVNKLFSFFNEKPVAAASIAQVHQAVLRDGRKVAIKVQRPGIKKLIETDMDILYHLAHLIKNRINPEMIDPVDIIEEFEKYTENELNFMTEARNINRFYKNFEYDKTTKIPEVFFEYTTEKVLTMSFITGTKLSELKTTKKGFSKKILAKNIVDSILTQVFIHGVFHADPHPGNILALKNNKVAFLDFGIVGHFDDELKDKITELFVAMISGNLEEIAESFTDIGIVGEETDIEEFKEDLYNNMEKYYDTSLDEINISSLFGDLLFLAKKYNMHMPSDLILLSKTIITTEGTALGLDPDFNFVEIGKPFVKSLVKSRVHPKEIMKKVVRTTHNLKRFIEKFPKQTNELIKRIKQGDKGIENIDRDLQVLAREMDRSSNRVALGLLITAFLISSAMIMGVEQKMIYGFPLYSSVGFLIGIMLLIMLLLSFMREKAR